MGKSATHPRGLFGIAGQEFANPSKRNIPTYCHGGMRPPGNDAYSPWRGCICILVSKLFIARGSFPAEARELVPDGLAVLQVLTLQHFLPNSATGIVAAAMLFVLCELHVSTALAAGGALVAPVWDRCLVGRAAVVAGAGFTVGAGRLGANRTVPAGADFAFVAGCLGRYRVAATGASVVAPARPRVGLAVFLHRTGRFQVLLRMLGRDVNSQRISRVESLVAIFAPHMLEFFRRGRGRRRALYVSTMLL